MTDLISMVGAGPTTLGIHLDIGVVTGSQWTAGLSDLAAIRAQWGGWIEAHVVDHATPLRQSDASWMLSIADQLIVGHEALRGLGSQTSEWLRSGRVAVGVHDAGSIKAAAALPSPCSVTVMTTALGHAGEGPTPQRISLARRAACAMTGLLEADGCVSSATVPALAAVGCDRFVVGTNAFRELGDLTQLVARLEAKYRSGQRLRGRDSTEPAAPEALQVVNDMF